MFVGRKSGLKLLNDAYRTGNRYAVAWYLGEVREARAIDGLVKMTNSWNFRDKFKWIGTVLLLCISFRKHY